eukprot:6254600-Pyramimonas_sp.AAC.1
MQNLMHVPEAVYLKVPEPTVVGTTFVRAPTEVKELTVAEVLEPTFMEKTFVLVPAVVETIF